MRRFTNLALLALAACAPDYAYLDVDPVSTPPVFVDITDASITLPAGIAVVVKASPRSGNSEDYDENNQLDLISQDRDVLTTFRRDDPRQFVLAGVFEGETCVEVRIDGDVKDCIPVLVEPPPS